MDKIQVRDVTVTHYQVWPEMDAETFAQLVSDIKMNGVTYPIILDENFTVLDGHHRLKAAKVAGLVYINCIVRDGLTEDEKLEVAHKANTYNRTITRKEKVKRAIQLRKEQRSFRQIAKWLGVGKSTIERWVNEYEEAVPNGTVKTIVGDDGKKYPAKKPHPQSHESKVIQEHRTKIDELEAENKKLREDIDKADKELLKRYLEIQQLLEELKREKIKKQNFANPFGIGSGGDLKVYALMVGLSENATVGEIDRAFRRARAKAHPDAEGSDWISQRYNSCYDDFKRRWVG
jgi:ParB-like chromosome segregation protein Spo0J